MCENETSESTWEVMGDIVATIPSPPADDKTWESWMSSMESWMSSMMSFIFCIRQQVFNPEEKIYLFLSSAYMRDSMTCDCFVPIGINTSLEFTRNPPLAKAVLNRNPDWLRRLLQNPTGNPVCELNAQNMTATAIANRLIADGNLNDTETKELKQMICTLNVVTKGAECNSATSPKRRHWTISPCSVLNEYCL
eukprot:GEMP01061754.1.p1 GENE.GEMP01061754.1~~GEMP01061754.1.p1  ORF type:complete len:194 (+),score=9.68 GEMP01061754.1:258-839(+)